MSYKEQYIGHAVKYRDMARADNHPEVRRFLLECMAFWARLAVSIETKGRNEIKTETDG